MNVFLLSLRLIPVLLCLATTVNAQWVRQYPMKKLEPVNDIALTNEGFGFAVGDNDLVLRLVGSEWQPRGGFNKDWDLQAVDVLENTNGTFVAAGGFGFILSQDAGGSWDDIENAPNFIHDILILTPTRIIVSTLTGVYLWDNNNWTFLNVPAGKSLREAHILDEDHFWGITDETNPVILYSSNGGDSWSTNSQIDEPDIVRFFNTQYGIAFDGRQIFKTLNGGQNWTEVSANTIHSSVNDIAFGTSPNIIMAATLTGEPAMSQDSGKTWSRLDMGTINQRNYSVAAVSDATFLMGNDISSITKTTDAGATWVETSGPNRSLLQDVHFTTRSEGIAVGSMGTVLRTSDGGTLWEEVPFDSTYICQSVHGLNSNDLWMGANRGTIFHSADKGMTWNEKFSFSFGTINDILAVSATRVLAVSSSGIIYRTNDVGASWDTVYQTNNQIRSIAKIDNQRYMATGYNGLLLKSNDQGETWNPSTVPQAGLQYEQTQFMGDEGWMITSSFENIMWHTTDAGNIWTPINLPVDRFWDGLYFITPDTGVVVGRSNAEGRAYITYNGGMTWETGYITNFPLFGVSGWPNPNGTAWIHGFGSDIEVLPYCNTDPVIGDFAGNLFPCESDTITYSISSQDAEAFNWDFPSGWIVIGNDNNDTVTVKVTGASGNVSVIASNICGFSEQFSFQTTPQRLPRITGLVQNELPCVGTEISYTVEALNADHYEWSLPSGWTIVGESDQATIQVVVGSESGNISVEASNDCSSVTSFDFFTLPYTLPVLELVSVDLTPCPGDTVTVFVNGDIDVTYVYNAIGLEDWSILNGGFFTINLLAGEIGGTFIISSFNQCGSSEPLMLDFSPEIITQAEINATDNYLFSLTPGESYQWYLNGQPIPGAVNDTIIPAVNGSYSCEVIFGNGCSSVSLSVDVIISGIFNPIDSSPLELYPVPVNDVLHLKNIENEYAYVVLDYTGKEVFRSSAKENTISVEGFADGLYLLKVTQGSRVYVGRFVKM